MRHYASEKPRDSNARVKFEPRDQIRCKPDVRTIYTQYTRNLKWFSDNVRIATIEGTFSESVVPESVCPHTCT